MAGAVILTDADITVDGTDLSSFCSQVSIQRTLEEQDVTTFGSSGNRERIAGFGDGTFTATFFQSWETNEVNDTLSGLIGTSVAVTVQPDGGSAISTTNPEYQFNVLVTDFTPMSAAAGEVATVDVSWPIDGAVTRDTTP